MQKKMSLQTSSSKNKYNKKNIATRNELNKIIKEIVKYNLNNR